MGTLAQFLISQRGFNIVASGYMCWVNHVS